MDLFISEQHEQSNGIKKTFKEEDNPVKREADFFRYVLNLLQKKKKDSSHVTNNLDSGF